MWLSEVRIVLADRVIPNGALCIKAGRIAEISETPVQDAEIRGGGRLLLPGFIDMHGDMIERAVEPRPNVRMPIALGLQDLDRALAGAGVTTAYAAVSFILGRFARRDAYPAHRPRHGDRPDGWHAGSGGAEFAKRGVRLAPRRLAGDLPAGAYGSAAGAPMCRMAGVAWFRA